MARSREDLPDYVTERVGRAHSLKAVLAVDGTLMLIALLVALAFGGPSFEPSAHGPSVRDHAVDQAAVTQTTRPRDL